MAGEGNQNEASKRKTTARPVAEVTPQTIQFEGLSGIDCRKWWQEIPGDHPIKASIRRA